jgi:hypothetical protein
VDESAQFAHRIACLDDKTLLTRWQQEGFVDAARPHAEAELIRRGYDPHAQVDTAPRPEEITDTAALVTVYLAASVTEASVVCAMLASHDIPAWVADANTAQLDRLYAVALGWSRVQVPVSSEKRAQELVATFRQGALSVPDDEEGDTPAPTSVDLTTERQHWRYRLLSLGAALCALYKLALTGGMALQAPAAPRIVVVMLGLQGIFVAGTVLLLARRAMAVRVFGVYGLIGLFFMLIFITDGDIGTGMAFLWDAAPGMIIAWCTRGWQRMGYLK